MPTIYHSSSEFLKDLAKGPIYLKSQSHNKILKDNVEMKINTITQYTSPVAFKKINTTSPITSTTKNTSTLSIQNFQYKQNLEPASEKFNNINKYKNETKYRKTVPKQIIDYDRGSISTSTDEIPKTTNITIYQKSGSEYTSDDISSNNNIKSDSSFSPDSDYTPNTTNIPNNKNTKISSKKAQNKKYDTTVSDYLHQRIQLRLQKIPTHHDKNITTIPKIVEQKKALQLTKKMNRGISQIQQIEKSSKIKYRNVATHDNEQQYQIDYNSEDTSSKLEEDKKYPYNNKLKSTEDTSIHNDKISLQHPKRLQKIHSLVKPSTTIKKIDNNTNRRNFKKIPDQNSEILPRRPAQQNSSIKPYIRRIPPKTQNSISGQKTYDGRTQKNYGGKYTVEPTDDPT